VTGITTLTSNGGRIDWSADGKTIAFDRINSSGYYDLWTMNADGSNQVCLSCNNPNFLPENNGNPAWYPTGKFIVYQSTNTTIKDAFSLLRGSSLYLSATNPGAGFRNDLWITTADGSKTWQLTNVGAASGTLHPHFSSDGSMLLWSQMTSTSPSPVGTWVLKLAKFAIVNGAPVISDIQTLNPGNLLFNEAHGFSPDGSTIIFTGSNDSPSYNDGEIYTYNLQTKVLKQLTNPNLDQWNEHAHFTPDGNRIIFMSSMGVPTNLPKISNGVPRTEFWIMNADGSNQQQLTHFNSPGYPEYIVGAVTASDSSVSPSGKQFVGFIQDNPTSSHAGTIVVVTLQ
jgi:Tol biopolymer transport system component